MIVILLAPDAHVGHADRDEERVAAARGFCNLLDAGMSFSEAFETAFLGNYSSGPQPEEDFLVLREIYSTVLRYNELVAKGYSRSYAAKTTAYVLGNRLVKILPQKDAQRLYDQLLEWILSTLPKRIVVP